MKFRKEHDSMGEVLVAENALWGAQTQRSLQNFNIGTEKMPAELINALVLVKRSCALANFKADKLSKAHCEAIVCACDELLARDCEEHFPLAVWQTGSGTQTNMNVNEVIARMATLEGCETHPNDHVNMSQSTNDAFPSAIHIAMVLEISNRLIPALTSLAHTIERLEMENEHIIKIGRTHLQDATPLKFSQELSAWRYMLVENIAQLEMTLKSVLKLAIGGTAVGTGINAPKDFDRQVCFELYEETGFEFIPDENKFHALSSKDALCFCHGALKSLAANLLKIANDVRWLASGPRCGFSEISIPENEPGSSIMPGKVNPTQCEALSMVAIQVMANDTAVGIAASQGNFQLNAYMPLIAHCSLQSVRLLSDAVCSFNHNCMVGLVANEEKMRYNLENSLMLVTCLSPKIGYEAAAKIAHTAHHEGKTLRETALSSGLLTEDDLNDLLRPEKMV